MAAQGATTGLMSAGVTGVLGGLGRLFKGATTNAPEAMANSVIGDTSKKTGQKIAKGAPTIGAQILQDPNLKTSDFFSAPRLQAAMQDQVGTQEEALQQILNSPEYAGKNISRADLIQSLQGLIEKGQNTPGQGGAASLVESIGNEVQPSYSLPDANVMKRNLYQAAKSQFGSPDAVTRAGAQKQLALGAKDLIEKATADSTGASPVTPINQQLGMYSQALSNILPKVGKEANTTPFMPSDALILGAGTAEGKPALGGIVDGVKHLLASPSGKLAVAKLMYTAGIPFRAADASGSMDAIRALSRIIQSNAIAKGLTPSSNPQ